MNLAVTRPSLILSLLASILALAILPSPAAASHGPTVDVLYSAAGNSAGVYDRDDQFFLRVRLGPHGDVKAHGIIRGEGFLLVAQGPVTAEFDEDGAIRSLVVTYKDPRAGGRTVEATIRTTGGTDDQGRHLAMLSVPGYSIPWPYVLFV